MREQIIQDVLERSIDNNTPLQILNVGAAIGKTSEMLGNYGPVTSIEYDKDVVILPTNDWALKLSTLLFWIYLLPTIPSILSVLLMSSSMSKMILRW